MSDSVQRAIRKLAADRVELGPEHFEDAPAKAGPYAKQGRDATPAQRAARHNEAFVGARRKLALHLGDCDQTEVRARWLALSEEQQVAELRALGPELAEAWMRNEQALVARQRAVAPRRRATRQSVTEVNGPLIEKVRLELVRSGKMPAAYADKPELQRVFARGYIGRLDDLSRPFDDAAAEYAVAYAAAATAKERHEVERNYREKLRALGVEGRAKRKKV